MAETGPTKKKPPMVYILTNASRCYACDRRLPQGEVIKLKSGQDEREVLCLKCAGLGDFVVIPGGNAKLTRLAAKYSPAHHVIMKWSELWKCYERQGLLAEPDAVKQAKTELGLS